MSTQVIVKKPEHECRQVLVPSERKRLQALCTELNPLKEFLVTRLCIATRKADEQHVQRRFVLRAFRVIALNGAEASAAADAMKFNAERDLGHHNNVRTEV